MSRHDQAAFDLGEDRDQPVAGKKRKRSAARWLLLLLVLVIAATWFAPTLLMKSNWRNRLVPWALPDFPGRVVIGSATVGWFQPIELRDIVIWDAEDQPIASIPLATSERNLAAFLSLTGTLGDFRLHNPEVQLTLTEKSSNLEDLIRPLLAPVETQDVPHGNQQVGFSLNVTEGRVLVTDSINQDACVLENLSFQVQVPDAPPTPLSVRISAECAIRRRERPLGRQFLLANARSSDGQRHWVRRHSATLGRIPADRLTSPTPPRRNGPAAERTTCLQPGVSLERHRSGTINPSERKSHLATSTPQNGVRPGCGPA